MPTNPTYPGVYIEEIPGVHTITGVSTSVTAFVGSAKRGSINKAVHILSFSDFERRFGGLPERAAQLLLITSTADRLLPTTNSLAPTTTSSWSTCR